MMSTLNNTSAGLRDHVILTNLVPKFWWDNKGPKYMKNGGM